MVGRVLRDDLTKAMGALRLMVAYSRLPVQLIALAVLLMAVTAVSFFVVYWLLPGPPHGESRRHRSGQDLTAALRGLSECTEGSAATASCSNEVLIIEGVLEQMDRSEFTYVATGLFDTYVVKGTVILRRRPCTRADVSEKTIAWSVWSTSSKPLTAQQQNDGEFGQYLPFDKHGHVVGEICFMVIHLPVENFRRLFVSLLDASRTKLFWKIDYRL